MESVDKRELDHVSSVQDREQSPAPYPASSGRAETALVARAQGGDPDAFGELVEMYQDRVYNTMYRMSDNHADALDLTQSAFLRALEALPRFDNRASFYTWLYRIAVNLALSHRRTQRRRPALRLHPADEDGPQRELTDRTEQPPDRLAEQQDAQRMLTDALEQLSDEFRLAVVLKDIENMDYATIAEMLEIPIGTVRSRIHRGRLLLRAYLKKEPGRAAGR